MGGNILIVPKGGMVAQWTDKGAPTALRNPVYFAVGARHEDVVRLTRQAAGTVFVLNTGTELIRIGYCNSTGGRIGPTTHVLIPGQFTELADFPGRIDITLSTP